MNYKFVNTIIIINTNLLYFISNINYICYFYDYMPLNYLKNIGPKYIIFLLKFSIIE